VWAIVAPSFLLDAFFDMHGDNWDAGQTNWSFGGEFIIRRLSDFDLVFSLDWADLRTTDTWWLESDDPIVDADWSENDLGLLTADVAIDWLLPIEEFWHLYYGVGLGVAFVAGDFLKQDVELQCLRDAGSSDPFNDTDQAFVRACGTEEGEEQVDPNQPIEEEDGVPPLIPALSLNFGTRFIIDEQWAIQTEIGFKNIYFYTGLELGYIWD
jgi:hypothetical protein